MGPAVELMALLHFGYFMHTLNLASHAALTLFTVFTLAAWLKCVVVYNTLNIFIHGS